MKDGGETAQEYKREQVS